MVEGDPPELEVGHLDRPACGIIELFLNGFVEIISDLQPFDEVVSRTVLHSGVLDGRLRDSQHNLLPRGSESENLAKRSALLKVEIFQLIGPQKIVVGKLDIDIQPVVGPAGQGFRLQSYWSEKLRLRRSS